MAFVACAPLERVDVDEGAAWVGAVGMSDGQVVDATGLARVGSRLAVDGDEVLVLAWAEEELLRLSPPLRPEADELFVGRDCEPALPPPMFAYRDGRSIDPGSVDLRLTTRWLAERCPCEVQTYDFNIHSVQLSNSGRLRLDAAVLDAEEGLLLHFSELDDFGEKTYRVVRSGSGEVPTLPDLLDLYVAPSGTRWLIDARGVVTRAGEAVDTASGGALVGPPPWWDRDATMIARRDGTIGALGAKALFDCGFEGMASLAHWENEASFTVVFRQTICRITNGTIAIADIGSRGNSNWIGKETTTHSTLGTFLVDQRLLWVDFDNHKLREVEASGDHTAIASWEHGLILGSRGGEIDFFSPDTGKIPLYQVRGRVQAVIRTTDGFVSVSGSYDSHEGYVVTYFQHPGCPY